VVILRQEARRARVPPTPRLDPSSRPSFYAAITVLTRRPVLEHPGPDQATGLGRTPAVTSMRECWRERSRNRFCSTSTVSVPASCRLGFRAA